MTTFLILILVLISIYAAMNAYLYVFQRRILYLPSTELLSPEHYGMKDAQEILLHTSDDLALAAWYQPARAGEPTLLYFHGNAGNLGDRVEKIQALLSEGLGILAVSYRGYGKSQGTPSEEGLYRDSQAALDWLIERGFDPERDIVLYGESLGTGLATHMAASGVFRAVILEAPYTSIADRAKELYPYIPVHALLKDHFNSLENMQKLRSPVLIFHGYRDEVMPITHGRKMLLAANEPKEARFYENIGHTDFDYQLIAKEAYRFIHQ